MPFSPLSRMILRTLRPNRSNECEGETPFNKEGESSIASRWASGDFHVRRNSLDPGSDSMSRWEELPMAMVSTPRERPTVAAWRAGWDEFERYARSRHRPVDGAHGGRPGCVALREARRFDRPEAG